MQISFPDISLGTCRLFWNEWKRNPESTAHNISLAFEINGVLDEKCLMDSISFFIHRYDALKLYFVECDNKIRTHSSFKLPTDCVELIDLCHSKRIGEDILRHIRQVREHIFDLTQPPLFKINLIKINDEHYFLACCFHHIIFDGQSEVLMMDIISNRYNGKTVLDNFIENRTSCEGDDKQCCSFWKNEVRNIRFSGNDLTAIETSKTAKATTGHFIYFSLDSRQVTKLENWIQRHESSLFCLLMAMYLIVLYRLSACPDWTICYPVDLRPQALKKSIGCFINVLPLTSSLSGDMSYADVLNAVTAQRKAQKPYQAYPFLDIVRDLRLTHQNQVSVQKLLRIALMQTHVKMKGLNLKGLSVTPVPETINEVIYDLSLEYERVSQGIQFRLNYREDKFDKNIIKNFQHFFRKVVDVFLESSEKKISEFSLLSNTEKKIILENWNYTHIPFSQESVLPELFIQQSKSTPDKPALVFNDSSVSYEMLNEQSSRLGAYLYHRRENRKSTRTLLVLDRGIQQVLAMLSVLKSGAAYVPIDPDCSAQHMARILQDCQSTQVLVATHYLEKVKAAASIAGFADVELYCIEDQALWQNYPLVLPTVTPDDLAYVLYTSGSTGMPKGVKISHRSLCNFLLAMKVLLKPNTTDNIVQLTSYSFDISALEIYLPLIIGSCCVIADGYESVQGNLLRQLIDRHKVRIVQTTPAKWQLLLDTGWYGSSAITILCGGEKLLKSLADHLSYHCKQLWNLYGPTETTIWSTAYLFLRKKNTCLTENVPIGKPLSNTQAYVLDSHLQPVPVGCRGELYIGGAGVAQGYLQREHLTRLAFLSKPDSINLQSDMPSVLYKTGDLVKWDSDGNLLYLGRYDQQVKHHGHRIELASIEFHLMEHTKIQQAVVVQKKMTTPNSSQLVAYYTATKNQDPPHIDELRDHLSQWLPIYCLPTQFILLANLPMTPNEKIDRQALHELPIVTQPKPLLSVKTSESLTKIIGTTLSLQGPVTNENNFFHLGGDSLSAARIAYAITKIFSIECSVSVIFNHPKVQDLALWIEGRLKKRSEHTILSIGEKPKKDVVPLSFAQKRFWFLSQVALEDRSQPNIVFAWHLRGKLDVNRLRLSLASIIDRHEILRTFYSDQSGEPYQYIMEKYVCGLEAKEILETELPILCQHEQKHTFNLSKEPPYRIRLFKLFEKHCVLLLNFHHIMADHQAIKLFLREISCSYNNLEKSEKYILPETSIKYAEFARWQADEMKTHGFKESLHYWRNRLQGHRALSLPYMRVNPPKISHEESFSFEIPELLSRQLENFCKQQQTTVFILLLCIFCILLCHYARQNDFIVGIPVNQRMDSAFEKALGCFVNTLPFRVNLSKNSYFSDFLERVKQIFAADFSKKDIPFDYLVDQLKIKRSSRGCPLIQTFFSVENDRDLMPHFNGVGANAIPLPLWQTKFDLTVRFCKTAAGLKGYIEYATTLFDTESARRLSRHFIRLLQHFIVYPQCHIRESSLLTPEEKQTILFDWNNTEVSWPSVKRTNELFEEQVRRSQNDVAVIEGKQSITYQSLNRQAEQLAKFLLSQGIKKGSLVPIVIQRGIALIISQLAVWKIGAAFVPLHPRTPSGYFPTILDETKAPFFLTTRSLYSMLKSVFDAQGLPSSHLICTDEVNLSCQAEGETVCAGTVEDLAYAIYTSGSTGKPKLVGVKHKSLVNLILWHLREYQISSADRASVVSSESFDALIWEMFPYLIKGATLCIADSYMLLDIVGFFNWLNEHQISVAFLPTSIVLRAFLEDINLNACTLRYLLTGGEQLTAFPNKDYSFKIVNHYGLTESSIVATRMELTSASRRKGANPTIGRPIANYKMYILDDYLNPVPVYAPGELYIAGVGVETRYLNHTMLNQERYLLNPFKNGGVADSYNTLYRTGDLACWLPDGSIQYLGRLDHQIKIRGFRVALGEIESALCAHPLVKQAVVVVKISKHSGKYLLAYLQTNEGQSIGHSVLLDFLKQRLLDYMLPRRFIVLKDFPMTIHNKIDRQALEELHVALEDGIDRNKKTSKLDNDSAYFRSIFIEILKELLEVNSIDPNANLFDIGVHSLLLIDINNRFYQKTHIKFSINDFFDYPTVSQLVSLAEKRFLPAGLFGFPEMQGSKMSNIIHSDKVGLGEVAIIGISCQFPGAQHVDAYWENLCQGKESISYFSDKILRNTGVVDTLLNDPNYVKARGVIQEAEYFDASFFHITPREAVWMDPQQRLFLQNAWHCLESAGYVPQKYRGTIGVFAGADNSSYFERILRPTLDSSDTMGYEQQIASNTYAFLSTKTSYKLGLMGPSLNINTACSTGLVVLDVAIQYLNDKRCDIALAGSASIKQPQIAGYRYQKDGIASPDGHCRAFDNCAAGTVPSGGIAVLALKRLEDAVQDRDTILSVIKGISINNDGMQKIGFTAPGVEGQIACISEAIRTAQIDPATVGYLETHGTGTALGDPIEIRALSEVFCSKRNDDNRRCPIGSVKTNIGHADAAAGMAGLIKTALILKNAKIPPTLHYTKSNAQIDFEKTPFYVNTKLKTWAKADTHPRRAGVSAFGIGGTNAHAILEEPPMLSVVQQHAERPYQLLIFSAKTATALQTLVGNLMGYIRAQLKRKNCLNRTTLANVAFTLQVGRCDFDVRRVVICRDFSDALMKLGAVPNNRMTNDAIREAQSTPDLVWLFPQEHTYYPNMGKLLYDTEPVFKAAVDGFLNVLKLYVNLDFKKVLFSNAINELKLQPDLAEDVQYQIALFCVEYALGKLYKSCGILPQAMLGYGVGELVAAHLSSSVSLETAVKLLVCRARLMHLLSKSGTVSDTQILAEFSDALTGIEFQVPKITVLSGITEQKITSEYVDPNYWLRHVRHFVEPVGKVEALHYKSTRPVFLICGPESSIIQLLKQQYAIKDEYIISSMASAEDCKNLDKAGEAIYAALAQLWLKGVTIDWEAYHAHWSRQRLPLPTYPFERQLYWPKKFKEKTERQFDHFLYETKSDDESKWLYEPTWMRLESLDRCQHYSSSEINESRWIVFKHDDAFCYQLIETLALMGAEVVSVCQGRCFKQLNTKSYLLNPCEPSTYIDLLNALPDSSKKYDRIIHLWGISEERTRMQESQPQEKLSSVLYQGFYSLLFLAKAYAQCEMLYSVDLLVVHNQVQVVCADDWINPMKSTVLAACQVLPLEYSHFNVMSLDFVDQNLVSLESKCVIRNLIIETLGVSMQRGEKSQFAYRGGYRWEKTFRQLSLPKALFTPELSKLPKGTYLITGGLGGMGLSLADYFCDSPDVHIALVSRKEFPTVNEWENWLKENKTDHPFYPIVTMLQNLKNKGASLSVWCADVTNYQDMQGVVGCIEHQYSAIKGIIHAAGLPASGLIQTSSIKNMNDVLRPKILGAYFLARLFNQKPLDFVVLCSSLTALSGGIGQVDYAAANACLDAFPYSNYFHTKTKIVVINWNAWREMGMHARALNVAHANKGLLRILKFTEKNSITPVQGCILLKLVLKAQLKQVIVSRVPLVNFLQSLRKQSFNTTYESKDLLAESYREKNQQSALAYVCALFQNYIGIDSVDPDDDFFELGGDSLSALSVMAAIEKQYGVSLSLTTFENYRTPKKLIQWIRAPKSSFPKTSLILANSEGMDPPLFLIHPVGGTTFCYAELARRLKNKRKLYVIQDLGLMQAGYGFSKLEDMSHYYLEQIQAVQKQGPYYIGGYSMGGTIAFEIAHQLKQSEEDIGFLALIDSWAVFTDQFHDKRFFEDKMHHHIRLVKKQLKGKMNVDVTHWLRCQWRRMQLLLNYHPVPIDCKIILFKAQELLPEYVVIDDCFNHWQLYSKRPVECYQATGNHDTLLTKPHVYTVVEELIVSFSKNSQIVKYEVK